MGDLVIIGMAGHIDHGKSALAQALTGHAMDRLAEEQKRGITIDLNFAPLQLGQFGIVGLVDVPGHENLVRTMVAGASGLDVALLVIAADEGVMPQTLEHLAVLEHLRVPAGIPVLTKADLASPEQLARLSEEVAARLARSPVEFEPPVITSVRSGEGIEALRSRIEARTRLALSRPPGDLFRMPVDRAFSIAGVGTVVTGTAWSGSVSVGEGVTLLPAGVSGRVRSIEGHGRALEGSEAGTRTAVGIAGIGREAISRGAVLVAEGDAWVVSTAIDVELTLQPDAPRPLGHRARVRILIGTAEVMARVRPRSAIEPGSAGVARLALEAPIVARAGDRFVVRSYSPVATIGGGLVLDIAPPRRAGWPAGLGHTDPEMRLSALLERRPAGIHSRELPHLLGLPPSVAIAVARRTAGSRSLGDTWVLESAVAGAATRAADAVSAHHLAEPASRGVHLETLRRSLGVNDLVAEAAIADLAAAGKVQVADGVVSLPGYAPRLAAGEEGIEALVRLVEEAGLAPPTLAELSAQTGRSDVAAAARLAAARGVLKAVERDRYYSSGALDRFTSALREAGRAGTISPAMLRDRLGVSRKFLIPLLEWADRQGITVRVPEGRRLAR
jgi:selenocysteine-specific elongation factor